MSTRKGPSVGTGGGHGVTIRFHPHALGRMRERGASRQQVMQAVGAGAAAPAKFGRTRLRRISSTRVRTRFINSETLISGMVVSIIRARRKAITPHRPVRRGKRAENLTQIYPCVI